MCVFIFLILIRKSAVEAKEKMRQEEPALESSEEAERGEDGSGVDEAAPGRVFARRAVDTFTNNLLFDMRTQVLPPSTHTLSSFNVPSVNDESEKDSCFRCGAMHEGRVPLRVFFLRHAQEGIPEVRGANVRGVP